MKKLLLIALLIVGCGTIEPEDCGGVAGGVDNENCPVGTWTPVSNTFYPTEECGGEGGEALDIGPDYFILIIAYDGTFTADYSDEGPFSDSVGTWTQSANQFIITYENGFEEFILSNNTLIYQQIGTWLINGIASEGCRESIWERD